MKKTFGRLKVAYYFLIIVSYVLGFMAWAVLLNDENPDRASKAIDERIQFYEAIIQNIFSMFGLIESPFNLIQQLVIVLWVLFALVNYQYFERIGMYFKNTALEKYARYRSHAVSDRKEIRKQFARYKDMPVEQFFKEKGYRMSGKTISAFLALFGLAIPIIIILMIIVGCIVRSPMMVVMSLFALILYFIILATKFFLAMMSAGVWLL